MLFKDTLSSLWSQDLIILVKYISKQLTATEIQKQSRKKFAKHGALFIKRERMIFTLPAAQAELSLLPQSRKCYVVYHY